LSRIIPSAVVCVSTTVKKPQIPASTVHFAISIPFYKIPAFLPFQLISLGSKISEYQINSAEMGFYNHVMPAKAGIQ
jgi:hypothetical protein